MKSHYFLDTSYIIALELKNEQFHQNVLENWLLLAQSRPQLTTTTYIFDEVVTFLNSRKLHSKAIDIGDRLLTSPDIELVEIDSRLFKQAWQYFQKHTDKAYSFTDCLSFVVMKNNYITIALTLDNHFLQAGFQVLPNNKI